MAACCGRRAGSTPAASCSRRCSRPAVYRYNSGALGNATVYGGELKGQVLPGWGFKRGRFELKLFAGPDLETHRLLPDDPSNSLRGTSVGLALATELWNEPTPTTMLAADASLSTIGPNYAARIAAGWQAFDQFYVGPEIAGVRRRRLPPVPRRRARHQPEDGELRMVGGGRLGDRHRQARQPLCAAGILGQRQSNPSVRRKRVTAMVMATSISTISAAAS